MISLYHEEDGIQDLVRSRGSEKCIRDSARGRLRQRLARERPERDGPDVADAHALAAQGPHRVTGEAGERPELHDQPVGVVGAVA